MSLSDGVQLRSYRKARILKRLAQRYLEGIVLFNPVNIRYAAMHEHAGLWSAQPVPLCFFGADGHTRLFDFRNCEHISAHLESVDEVRPSKVRYHIAADDGAARSVQVFADEMWIWCVHMARVSIRWPMTGWIRRVLSRSRRMAWPLYTAEN